MRPLKRCMTCGGLGPTKWTHYVDAEGRPFCGACPECLSARGPDGRAVEPTNLMDVVEGTRIRLEGYDRPPRV